MTTIHPTITPGEVRVERVDCVLDSPCSRAWHLDLRSKYASIGGVADDEVLLVATEETLYVDEALRGTPTVINLDVPDDWTVLAEVARYTCRVVAYQPAYTD